MTTVPVNAERRSVLPVRRGRLARVLYALVLDPSKKFGSLEEQAFLLARACRDEGGLFLPLFQAAEDPGTVRRYAGAGLEVAFLDPAWSGPRRLWRLLGLVRRHRIEVVHWNFCPPLGNGLLWALSLLAPRLRHYFTDHNSRPVPLPPPPRGPRRAVKGRLLRRYARVLGVSDYVSGCLRRDGWPAAQTCLHFINTDRFVPDPDAGRVLRQRLGDVGGFVLVTVAYLIAAKGIDVTVRALAGLPEAVRLWVVGDGPEEDALRRLAEALGVADRVRFLGLQAHVQPYLQAADAFVCPSLWAEAAGLVNLEAQACGLPVLASDIGGIPEYVADGRTGLLFPPGDADALAGQVRRLLDPALRDALGRQARAVAVERFSVAARLHAYLDLYRVGG
jgi:glycosyltransferase involved in cell wall biosynthesis